MKQPIVACLTAGAWAAGLFGVLSLQYLPDRFFGEHSVCGPWGCGAPLPVLLACHGFWAVLFAPSVVYAAWRLEPTTVWRWGVSLLGLAGIALAAIAVWQALSWWPQVDSLQRQYLVQRYLFVLATLVDVPVLEMLVAGVTLYWAAIWRQRSWAALRARSSSSQGDGFPAVEPRPESNVQRQRGRFACSRRVRRLTVDRSRGAQSPTSSGKSKVQTHDPKAEFHGSGTGAFLPTLDFGPWTDL